MAAVPVGAAHIDNPAFARTWERHDKPVNDGLVERTWIWGASVTEDAIMEPYLQSPGGMREVQYFDKSRMEINQPGAPSGDLWYVTNGLLVNELVNGEIQVGNDQFEPMPGGPADIPIAGDPNSDGHSYADINRLGLRDRAPNPVGSTIIESIDADGNITSGDEYAGYGVEAAIVVDDVPGVNHSVASVFWAFLNSEGLIWVDGEAVNGPLFENPFYATGYPITEPYWDTVPVGGTELDVLWQCFERRCLTYTQANPDGFKVEAGNVGQHYYRWRYETPTPPPGPGPTDPVEVTDQAFYAELDTAQEVPEPEVVTAANGDAVFFVDGDGNLAYEVILVDIQGVTAAHIHLGMPGETGPVVVTLFMGEFSTGEGDTGTLVTGVVTAAELEGDLEGLTLGHLLAQMEAGNTYVNVHTEANPSGEIRGQIELIGDDMS
jgi:hypothetical protein